MTATHNGRPQRKQLSDQLDRLDTMIDCLSEALPQAVADATREGTRSAVRDILSELLRDPEVLARLRDALVGPAPARAAHPATPPAPPAPPAPESGLLAKVGRGVGAASAAGRRAFTGLRESLRRVRERVSAAVETAQAFVPVRRFAATAAVVGVAVAAVSYVAPQGVSAVVSGAGAVVMTAAVQTWRWLRKSARSVGLLA
jgi:hypothetical protein